MSWRWNYGHQEGMERALTAEGIIVSPQLPTTTAPGLRRTTAI
jgi:hypothetical protein